MLEVSLPRTGKSSISVSTACDSVKYKAAKVYFDEPQTSGEMEEPNPTLTPGGGVNQPNRQECESRCVRPNQRLYADYSVRQRRRRTTFKAQKPQPYLKPVSSYRHTRKHQFFGRSGQNRPRNRRRKVSYAESIYSYTPIGVANKEELLDIPKPELAYLIVDLISGTPVFELSDSDTELEERNTKSATSQESRESPTMSMTAVDKPMPLPRKKQNNINSSMESPTSSTKKTSPPPPVPIRKSSLIKVVEDTLSPSSEPNDYCIPKKLTEIRETSPQSQDNISAAKPIPAPRDRSKSTSGNRPIVHTNDESTTPSTLRPRDSPPPAAKAPPLPSKSERSREIQRSIKRKPTPREPPPIPKPYGTQKSEEIIISTQSNDCYGAQEADGYEISDIPFASTAVDEPEQLYIDPLQSLQMSPEKTKPPRPPLPSSTAIRKAQQRKAKTLTAASKQSRTQLTKKHSNKTTTYRPSNLHSKATTDHRKKQISNPPPSSPSSAAPHIPNDYEELDIDDPYSPPDQSYPPPVVITNTGQIICSESNLGDLPPLPPRSSTPGSRGTQHVIKHTTSKPIPSGFTLNSNMDTVDSRRSNEQEQEGNNPERYDDDSIYEPIDTSLPVTPKRTKWNVRGTRTLSPVDPTKPNKNVYQKEGVRSSPIAQRKTTQQISKQALVETSSVSQLKSSRSLLKPSRSFPATEKDLVTKVSELNVKEDVPCTEEYVEMECRVGWASEEEGGQELYVDMQPVNMHEDGEDVPCMECFTSHDRDIRQDLRT